MSSKFWETEGLLKHSLKTNHGGIIHSSKVKISQVGRNAND